MANFRDMATAATEQIIDAFGEEFEYQGTLDTIKIVAIFRENVPGMNDYIGEVVSEGPPQMQAKTRDMANVKPHDTVTVGLKTYEVIEINHDGYGESTIRLNKLRDDG